MPALAQSARTSENRPQSARSCRRRKRAIVAWSGAWPAAITRKATSSIRWRSIAREGMSRDQRWGGAPMTAAWRVDTAGRDNGKQRRSRPTGYAPWAPRAGTRQSVEQILSVLDDHRDYWPITPRQVLYRLVGRGQ